MSVATRLAQAARGDLARLVAVVAVFAGLVLAHGMQCSSAMGLTVPAGHACTDGAMHDNDVQAATGMVHDQPHAGTNARTSADPGAATSRMSGSVLLAVAAVPEAPGSGGLLGTCLTFVIGVVVLIVFAGLRPTLLRIHAVRPSQRRVAMLSLVPPRAASLAELCLLRT